MQGDGKSSCPRLFTASRNDARRATGAVLLAAGGIFVIQPVVADVGTEPETLEMVVVTARKREENLQQIPMAITALPKDLIEDGNFDELNEYMALVPNVSFKNDQFTSSDISIRGSSRNSNAEDPGVAVYRDGVYVGGLLTNTSTFYDVDRVEILRGPQAGLYGRNAVGGAVNIYTTKPSFDGVKGYAEGKFGNLEHGELKGAINFPLIANQLAVRISGQWVDQPRGFQRIVNLHEYADSYRNTSFRARVLFTPVDDLEFLTTVEHFKSNGAPGGMLLTAPFGSPFTIGGLTFPPTNGSTLQNMMQDRPFVQNADQTQAIQEVDWKVGPGTLTGVAGRRSTHFFNSADNDGTILDLSSVVNDDAQQSTYAEVHYASDNLRGLHIVGGANYLEESLTLNQEYTSGGLFNTDLASWFTTGQATANNFGIPVGTPISAFGFTPLGNSGGWQGYLGDSFPVRTVNEQHLKSMALFTELSYELTPALELWTNLRYTHDTKHISLAQNFDTTFFTPCPVACVQVFDALVTNGVSPVIALNTPATFTRFSPGGGVNYTFDDDMLMYAKVVTGFKAGGFNPLASSAALVPFGEETTISYELGVKTSWLQKRMTFNTAVFYQQRNHAVVMVPDPLFSSIGVSVGVNAGKINNRGVEAEFSVKPLKRLDITLVGGYLDSKFGQFVSNGVNYSGNQVPQTFKYTFTGIVRYTVPLTAALDGFGYVSYTNAWDGFTNADNARPLTLPLSIDLRAGLKGGSWKAIGYVDNLTDHRYAPYESYTPGAPETTHVGTISPGRTYGVQLSYEF